VEKFNIIYADPPWQYSDAHCNGAAENHYPTLKLKDLIALPVEGIAADDAVLFLWATMPLLPHALDVIKAWGFDYVSQAFAWKKTYEKSGKPVFGLGRWTRGNLELVLLARRGKPKRIAANVFSLIEETDHFLESPRLKHSAKPPIVRDKIVQLMGDLPRVELFARSRVEGWYPIGNEIDGRDVRDVLRVMTHPAVANVA
jgi:N6-adenosine-specific RNA methylase IME4